MNRALAGGKGEVSTLPPTALQRAWGQGEKSRERAELELEQEELELGATAPGQILNVLPRFLGPPQASAGFRRRLS